ncbi:MAG: hypothetical protein GDA41_09700 [Rhodospirillales bacterium]|nr:hypothetical protein [Rhodospirillales bacterium]
MCPACGQSWQNPGRSNDSRTAHVLYLDDSPGHGPADLLRLLVRAFWPILDAPLRSTLPRGFEGAELSPTEPAPRAERDTGGNLTGRYTGHYEDGTIMDIGSRYR